MKTTFFVLACLAVTGFAAPAQQNAKFLSQDIMSEEMNPARTQGNISLALWTLSNHLLF